MTLFWEWGTRSDKFVSVTLFFRYSVICPEYDTLSLDALWHQLRIKKDPEIWGTTVYSLWKGQTNFCGPGREPPNKEILNVFRHCDQTIRILESFTANHPWDFRLSSDLNIKIEILPFKRAKYTWLDKWNKVSKHIVGKFVSSRLQIRWENKFSLVIARQ